MTICPSCYMNTRFTEFAAFRRWCRQLNSTQRHLSPLRHSTRYFRFKQCRYLQPLMCLSPSFSVPANSAPSSECITCTLYRHAPCVSPVLQRAKSTFIHTYSTVALLCAYLYRCVWSGITPRVQSGVTKRIQCMLYYQPSASSATVE